MKLICKSGLGDIGFHNIHGNRKTGRLVFVDTEPLFGSLLLQEKDMIDDQYDRTNTITKHTTMLGCIVLGFDNMILHTDDLSIFKRIAEIYKQCLLEVYSS